MAAAQDVTIVPYRDGPYLVRGPVSMQDQSGDRIVLVREPIALCRCGRSRTRPFCDGTHRLVGFSAPSGVEGVVTSGFQKGSNDTDGARIEEFRPGADLPRPSLLAQAALRRARRAVELVEGRGSTTMSVAAGQRARALITGAIKLLEDTAARGEGAAPLLLIDGAINVLTPVAASGCIYTDRVVAELRAAADALETTP